MTSLFNESKALLAAQNPVLAAVYEREFLASCADTPEQVSEYWCNKIYNLEAEHSNYNLLHHRAYLKEAWKDPYFWLDYFKKKIIPLFSIPQLA